MSLDETKTPKTVFMPAWLIESIEDYRIKNKQSFGAAMLTLIAVGMNEVTKDEPSEFGYFGGNKQADSELYNELETLEVTENRRIEWEEFFIKKFSSNWGGSRKKPSNEL